MAKQKSITPTIGGYLVLQSFRDKDNFSIAYEVGDSVSHFEQERLNSLVEKGLVKAI